MKRRDFFFGAVAAGAAASLGWSRNVQACGNSVDLNEEEFLDIGPFKSETKRELARFFTSLPLHDPDERFCAGPNGQGLAFAELDGVGILSPSGQRNSVVAPEGARLLLDRANGRLVVHTIDTGPHDQIFVVDPRTVNCEPWGQVWTVKNIEPTPLGLAVSHREFGFAPGRLSLLERRGSLRELRQFEAAPTPICALGTQLVYFDHETAYTLDLTKSDPPKVMGHLPSWPDAAVLTRHGITAKVEDEIWRLLPNGTDYRMFSAKDVFALFSQGDAVVVGSPNRVWIYEGSQGRTIEGRNGNLHYVAPIDGTSDLILCRGPAVLRYSRATGRTEHIGTGRPKMKLNGAAIANDELFTWSSRTWATTTHSCSVVPPSAPYLHE